MTWIPPERPEWVHAINRGEILPLREEAEQPLERDSLLGEAAARQGRATHGGVFSGAHSAFDHPEHPVGPVLENLDRLLPALDEEAELSVMGRCLARRFLLRLLEVRIQILDALRADPSLREETIRAPLFVAGAPRTGTTILYELLALDPGLRAPRGWELLRPVPSPPASPPRTPEYPATAPDTAERARGVGSSAFPEDPRIALAHRELVAPQTVVDGIRTIHAYGARQPKECLSAMSFALQSEEFTARYRVPSYQAWLESSDMQPAYAMHRLVLQILQRRQPDTAWVLKSPVHLHSLPTLFSTYPDARVVITHRDPLRFLGSLTSLICNLRWAHSDVVDPTEIAEGHHRRYARTLGDLAEGQVAERWPSDQIQHSLFQDFLEDPIRVVESVYARAGLDFGPAHRARLEGHPSALQAGPAVPHRYATPAEGAEVDAARRDFERYQQVFSVPNDA
jgi:hypothetical protein